MSTLHLSPVPAWKHRAAYARAVAIAQFDTPFPHLRSISVRTTPQDSGVMPVTGPIYSMTAVEVTDG